MNKKTFHSKMNMYSFLEGSCSKMAKYFLTAYSKSGEHLLNEIIEADSDNEASDKGKERLDAESLSANPSRVVRSSGGLVHFHP
ncbi:YhzD-like protein [Salipaludibacillus aurantiacus]|uniref:YhzD-like protein n=2 Tax=Salipaludibacillus aurantiacus TaxID=1601833 RepID=A0A1H9RN85_9BACI|nr:YhzD-like protein [Salipaludibacillus aurantiacus]